MDWNEVLQDERFTSLSQDKKAQVAQKYFNDFYANDQRYTSLPEDKRSHVYSQFMETVGTKVITPPKLTWGEKVIAAPFRALGYPFRKFGEWTGIGDDEELADIQKAARAFVNPATETEEYEKGMRIMRPSAPMLTSPETGAKMREERARESMYTGDVEANPYSDPVQAAIMAMGMGVPGIVRAGGKAGIKKLAGSAVAGLTAAATDIPLGMAVEKASGGSPYLALPTALVAGIISNKFVEGPLNTKLIGTLDKYFFKTGQKPTMNAVKQLVKEAKETGDNLVDYTERKLLTYEGNVKATGDDFTVASKAPEGFMKAVPEEDLDIARGRIAARKIMSEEGAVDLGEIATGKVTPDRRSSVFAPLREEINQKYGQLDDTLREEIYKERYIEPETGAWTKKALDRLREMGLVNNYEYGFTDINGLKFMNKFDPTYTLGDIAIAEKVNTYREVGLDVIRVKGSGGDEFVIPFKKGVNKDALINKANEIFKNKKLIYETPDGKIRVLKGASFKYGFGETPREAAIDLDRRVKELAELGTPHPPAGAKPSGLAEIPASRGDVPVRGREKDLFWSNPFLKPSIVSEVGPEAVGALYFGTEIDDDGNIKFSPVKAILGAAAVSGYARVPIKGKTIGGWTWHGVSKGFDKLFSLPGLRAFHPTGGVSEDLWKLKRQAQLETGKMQRKGLAVADRLIRTLSREERELVSDVIEQEGNFQKASARIVKQAEEVKKWNNQLGKRLVDAGMLDAKTFERNTDTYLHRVYDPTITQKVKVLGRRAKEALSGGWSIRRGEKEEINIAGVKEGDVVYGVFKPTENKQTFRYISEAKLKAYQEKGWIAGKKWTVMNAEGNKATLHRDFNRLERQMRGENRDVALRFGIYTQEVAHDIAMGNMYQRIQASSQWFSRAPKEGWSQVPDVNVGGAKGGIKKYGSLSGGYVHPDVMRVLHATRAPWRSTSNATWNAIFKGYSKALGAWKLGMTAGNPTVQYNNFVSNMGMCILDGRNPAAVLRHGAAELFSKGKIYQEAVDAGLLDSNIIKGEKLYREELNKIARMAGEDSEKNISGIMHILWGGVKKGGRGAVRLYELGDEIYKLGVFKQERLLGMTAEDAIGKANHLFFDYSDVPIGIQAVRDFGYIPFISYTYKALPTIAQSYTKHPYRMLAVYGLLTGLNEMAYKKLYGKDAESRERLEREVMPEYMKGRTAIFAPKNIRLPFNKQTDLGESARFADISRIFPGGNVFDVQPGIREGMPWPDILGGNPLGNNPLVTIAEGFSYGKDPYFGKDIFPYDEPLNTRQKAANVKAGVQFIARRIIPNNPAIPGSWSFDKVGNALTASGDIPPDIAEYFGWTGKDFAGRGMEPKQAIGSSVGIKVRDVNVDESLDRRVSKYNRMISEKKAEIRRLYADQSKTESFKQKRLNEIMMDIEDLGNKISELYGGTQ